MPCWLSFRSLICALDLTILRCTAGNILSGFDHSSMHCYSRGSVNSWLCSMGLNSTILRCSGIWPFFDWPFHGTLHWLPCMDSCAVCSMGFDHSSMYCLGFDHSDWPSHGTGLAKQFFHAFEWIPEIRSFFDALFSGHSAILRYAFEWIPDTQSGRWNSSMHHLSGNSAIHSMRSKYPSGSMSAEIQVDLFLPVDLCIDPSGSMST